MEENKKTTIKNTNSEIQTGYNRFVFLREQYGMKNQKSYLQKEFAPLLGIAPAKISELEKGKRDPSLNEAIAYNRLTGASLEYLLGIDTEANKRLGLTQKSTNNLAQLYKCPDTQNAFIALNHLLSFPDAVQFLNMLFQLWISPVYDAFEFDLAQMNPNETAESLLKADSPLLSYAVKCNVERQLLNFIDSHGLYDEKEYKRVTASTTANTATPNDVDELLDS